MVLMFLLASCFFLCSFASFFFHFWSDSASRKEIVNRQLSHLQSTTQRLELSHRAVWKSDRLTKQRQPADRLTTERSYYCQNTERQNWHRNSLASLKFRFSPLCFLIFDFWERIANPDILKRKCFIYRWNKQRRNWSPAVTVDIGITWCHQRPQYHQAVPNFIDIFHSSQTPSLWSYIWSFKPLPPLSTAKGYKNITYWIVFVSPQ